MLRAIAAVEERFMAPGLPHAEQVEAGLIVGQPSSMKFGPWDPMPNHGLPPREEQPEDIWEEEDGIQSHYQPHTIYRTEPKLFGPVGMWNAGIRELSLYEYRELSAFEISTILTLSSADYRRRHPEKDEDGGR